jgi:proteic killer suppression protein
VTRIVSIRHKGLARLWRADEARGVPADQVQRIRAALTLLSAAPNLRMVGTVPGWRLHELKGERKGTWSLTITRNWRLTFRVEGGSVHDIDFEDYH